MDLKIIIPVGVSLIIIVIIIWKIIELKVIKCVKNNSSKLTMIIELNKKYNFHNINDKIEIYKRYDNKSHYNKIEPGYLMAAQIREKINLYADYIDKMCDNRNLFKLYNEDIEKILSSNDSLDFNQIKFPEKFFRCYEKKLLSKLRLIPTIDCEFAVSMHYSSPKQRVQLCKGKRFTFNDLLSAFESVSRSHLDKKTYQELALVERGEVSDSLRYDILKRDNYRCVICGASSEFGARLHVDHIIPIAKGGKSIPSNLQTLCERCNIGKSDKIDEPTEKNDTLCPLCNSTLILRKGTYGEFYGCSKYPKCKYTRKV